LIKNTDKTLPLDKSTVKSVAVIGPNAKQGWDISAYYGPSTSCNEDFWNVVDAVQQYVKTVTYDAGLVSTLTPNTSGIPAAAAAAAAAEVVVLALGTDLSAAAEGHDAINISLPYGQMKLLEAVTAAASNPIIVVMITAVPLDISKLLANPKVGAVIHAGQPSVQMLGIGDAIFGIKVPYGARFLPGFCTRGCYWIPHLLA
jgi:hypothetical protein